MSVQGLHPLKDSAFVVFEGESFRETLLTWSAVVAVFLDCFDPLEETGIHFTPLADVLTLSYWIDTFSPPQNS